MNSWRLALRNVRRNTRRSMATVLAIALSCAGLMLFGGYISWAHLAGEVHAVLLSGHLQLFREGKTAGHPGTESFANYAEIRQLLLSDRVLGPQLDLVTGQLIVQGMASSAEKGTSATFAGVGAFPSDIDRIVNWNPYGLTNARDLEVNRHLFGRGPELAEDDPEGVTLGEGLARSLDLLPLGTGGNDRPAVDLMSLPAAGGLPNMASASVRQTSIRAMESIDNHLVVMPLAMASELVFPGEPPHVSSVILLLKKTSDLPAAKERVMALGREHGLGIVARDCWELNPNHVRSLAMMDMFFVFALCIVTVVLVFTIYNTVVMGIVERSREIGAIRAMGMTRGGVVSMFVHEGLVLGIVGGIAGIALGLASAWIVNRSMILYQPPYVNVQAKLELLVDRSPLIVAASFAVCFIVALVGAVLPARRASLMPIADCLRS